MEAARGDRLAAVVQPEAGIGVRAVAAFARRSTAAGTPPSRPPTNWKFSMTTLILLRFSPPCLSSQESYLIRPSMKIGLPFWKYWLINSPVLPKAASRRRSLLRGPRRWRF